MSPMNAVRPRVSYADLERAPEDGRRYEMVHRYALDHGGLAGDAPIDIVFSEYDVLQPDVVYFSPARAHLVDIERVIRHAPDLCVEVVSPSTAAADRGKKMQIFARYGVPEYWIVDPSAESIEVYELASGAYALRVKALGAEPVSPPVLPGLTFSAASLFRSPHAAPRIP